MGDSVRDMDGAGRELYLYECTDCRVVFGVDAAYEDHSHIVCPVCISDESLKDAGCAITTVTREPEEPKCRVCGCTESRACEGGCYWVEPDLCSRCAAAELEGEKSG
ncbi:MAG: hypothetical protein K6T81_13905 [Alicyclobacillus macrosporangiidus]|uniref:hypothetical protein n=1 Tax=Alicyclobacillus macrosporangiidus TaxID=392015 RepID=UPI0026EF1B81|nr:hypothetical protein [Alicyclobacillus macrosporangiidus]MCL6599810.1 hypothetical protein [Alicyclobacillus macrosporangiidus]